MGTEPRHPADAANLPSFVAGPPTRAAIERVRDVIVVPTTHVEGDYLREPPAGSPPVELAEGLTIEALPHEDVELVMNACMPRGHYFIAVRQYGERYSFIRHLDPAILEQSRFGWDDDHLIFHTMVLSRLVRDNGHSLEFAARIVDYEDGMRQVIPVIAPSHVATYRLRQDRDWLTREEAVQLRDLVADFLPIVDDLPWPVVHALNMAEDAVHFRIIQRAVLLIATGLEGLIQSSSSGVSRQFRERLPRLADDVGVAGIDEQFARELYDARSEAAHGAQVSMFRVEREPSAEGDPELPHGEPEEPEPELEPAEKLALAQDLLRAAVRKAMHDAEFRHVFGSPDAIDERWPLGAVEG